VIHCLTPRNGCAAPLICLQDINRNFSIINAMVLYGGYIVLLLEMTLLYYFHFLIVIMNCVVLGKVFWSSGMLMIAPKADRILVESFLLSVPWNGVDDIFWTPRNGHAKYPYLVSQIMQ